VEALLRTSEEDCGNSSNKDPTKLLNQLVTYKKQKVGEKG
jgi:hypothetical protein